MGSSKNNSNAITVGLCGAAGRMGREIFRAAAMTRDIVIAKAYEAPGHPALGAQIGATAIQPDDADDFLEDCAVLVDFSAPPDALPPHLQRAAGKKVAAIIGSTGASSEFRGQMERLASKIPLLYAANMSLGINLLTILAQRVQELLPGAFDVDIVEMHHRTKRDAPSGTALMIAEQMQRIAPDQKVTPHSIRAGDIIGEHTVLFTGVGERLELIHRASSREAFAQGTLAAVRFIVDQRPGLYNMRNVLGL